MQEGAEESGFFRGAVAVGFFFEHGEGVDEVLGLFGLGVELAGDGVGTSPRATMACVPSVVIRKASEAGGSS